MLWKVNVRLRQILGCCENLTDEEFERLTTVLMFHLVHKCGGHVTFTKEDANKIVFDLCTKMVYLQIDEGITLRIVTRPPELQEFADET